MISKKSSGFSAKVLALTTVAELTGHTAGHGWPWAVHSRWTVAVDCVHGSMVDRAGVVERDIGEHGMAAL